MDTEKNIKYKRICEKLGTINSKIEYLKSDIDNLKLLINQNINIDGEGLNEIDINNIYDDLKDIFQNINYDIKSIKSKIDL